MRGPIPAGVGALCVGDTRFLPVTCCSCIGDAVSSGARERGAWHGGKGMHTGLGPSGSCGGF